MSSATPPPPPEKKDKWDKLEILSKSVFAVLISVGVTVWGWRVQNQRQMEAAINREQELKEAQENRRAEVLVQALASQDIQRTSVKKDMFQALTDRFFEEDDIEEQLIILELLSLNFSNRQFKLRPLFIYLEEKIISNANTSGSNNKSKNSGAKLERVIKNLKAEEISHILATGGIKCDIDMKKGDVIQFYSDDQSQSDVKLITEYCNSAIGLDTLPIKLKLAEIEESEIKIDYFADKHTKEPFRFTVTKFDTPFSDNTQILDPDDPLSSSIFSIILDNGSNNKITANISFILFPEFFYRGEVSPINLDRIIGEKFIQQINNENNTRDN